MYRTISTIIFMIIALLSRVEASNPMDFRIYFQPDLREKVVIGQGEIVQGDADRFAEIAQHADRDKFGNVTLVLDSPGGSVKAAFEMVDVMDEIEVSTIVPDNAICASACASILFVSGRYHDVRGTGILGLHTCYKRGPTEQPDSFCNDLIAKNAFMHGTSYAAVDFAQQEFSPEKMAWIDRKLACQIGLCGPPSIAQVEAIPSFSCSRASNAAEREICRDRRLARYDREIDQAYKNVQARAPEIALRQKIAEMDFIATRDRCSGTGLNSCILQTMRKRLGELRASEFR